MRTLKAGLFSVVIAVLALGLSSQAQAVEYLQCGWRITGWTNAGCPTGVKDNDSCGCTVNAAPKWYGARLAMSVENEGGNGISASDFVRAAQEGAQAWTSVDCANLIFTCNSTLPANSDARWGNHNNDNDEHGVFFVSSENEWITVTGSGSGGTLGVTVSPYSGGCTGRNFFDTDILINGVIQGGWSYNSLKTTVTHEMGHALGLGHPCLIGDTRYGCDNACRAIMGATGGEWLVPQQDDINGICNLYPGTAGGIGAACETANDCDSAPLCIDDSGFKYCSHLCPPSCETGYDCNSLNGQDVCVRQGAPGVGDTCSGACADGATCVVDGGTDTAPIAHCYANCEPGASVNTCPTDYRCSELTDGSGICWPPGSQALGEQCGSTETGDCAGGLVCIGDGGTTENPIAHCYAECDSTRPASCGSAQLCYRLSDGTGVCLAAADPGQECESTQYVCIDGWECTPPPDGGDTYICNRSCTINQADSCGDGETCQTFVDQDNNPVAAACYPEGNKLEGEACNTGLDCVSGLICVSTGGISGECLVSCNPASPSCPHAGQDCLALSGSSDGVCSPAGGTTTTTDGGVSSNDAASSGTDAGDPINPGGAGYLEPCNSDSDCAFNICRGVGGRGSICLLPCDPRLGHYDCPTVEQSGCVPNDPAALNFGGQCQPDVVSATVLAVGASCNNNTGYTQCSSGLCEGSTCLMVCNAGSCPEGFSCDISEIADPGICRPMGKAPGCGCAGQSDPSAVHFFALGLLGALLWRRRRR